MEIKVIIYATYSQIFRKNVWGQGGRKNREGVRKEQAGRGRRREREGK